MVVVQLVVQDAMVHVAMVVVVRVLSVVREYVAIRAVLHAGTVVAPPVALLAGECAVMAVAAHVVSLVLQHAGWVHICN